MQTMLFASHCENKASDRAFLATWRLQMCLLCRDNNIKMNATDMMRAAVMDVG